MALKNMSALYELQREFLAGIYDATATQPLLKKIQTHARVLPMTQFDIYRHSVVARLQKALKAIYPVCHQLVGDEFFMHMASCYIAVTPSRSPDLNSYGETLPDFIRLFKEASSLPYLSDVTALEWAWHRLYGAPDSQAFDFVKLAQYAANGEDIIFSLPPRATLLQSPYPVHRIWEVNQTDYTDDTTVTLVPDQSYAIYVWQQAHVFHIDLLTNMEWQVLAWFQQALSLETVCENATAIFPDLNMAELLPEFVQRGWLADVMIRA